nr:hypothetical protein 1 [bacterium]
MAHATTPTHGKTCRVEKNGTEMDFTSGWTIHSAVDLAEVARQGQDWKGRLPGQGEWNGTFGGQLVLGNTEQKAIVDNIINATPGTKLTDMEFNLDSASNYFSGDIYIQSLDISAPVGGVLDFNVNFVGDSAISLTAA